MQQEQGRRLGLTAAGSQVQRGPATSILEIDVLALANHLPKARSIT